jgi:acid stress-induced BolA-like protein IbaG/YrbA
MELAQVERLILDVIPDAQIKVEGEGCNFTVTVVSNEFEGQSPVARQKKVLAPFKALIASGDIHALGVKALTAAEKSKILP